MNTNNVLYGHMAITVPTKMYVRDIVYALTTSDLELSKIQTKIYENKDSIGSIIYIIFEKDMTDSILKKMTSLEFAGKVSSVIEKSKIKYFSITTLFGANSGGINFTGGNIQYPE